MTAEIAVMNKDAIALAADSAVTVGMGNGDRRLDKVFTSANKIFALSKYEPMAIMFYGNATLMSVPWEAIIKLYRQQLARKQFAKAEQYAADFLKFLHQHTKLFPEDKCVLFFQQHIHAFYSLILEEILELVADPNAVPKPIALDSVKVEGVIERHAHAWKQADYLQTADAKAAKSLKAKYKKQITEVIDHVFAEVVLTTKARASLLDMGVHALVKCPKHLGWGSTAGVVVAGFGSEDFFPVLESFSINGVFGGHLNYRQQTSARIGFDNPVGILPFAQPDVVYTFMEGVDPNYQRTVEQSTEALLKSAPEKIIDSCAFLDDPTKARIKSEFASIVPKLAEMHFKALAKNRGDMFWRQVVNLIEVFPKPELAALAESMVTLTALRRKVEAGVETVAGPIDVALISKGDGFIWIKRKHYFDPKLNHQFFTNYFPTPGKTV
jgi:hypothetical protein